MLLRGYDGVNLPSRGMGALLLTLMLSLIAAAWLSPARGVSFVYTWWVGSLAAVFFLCTLGAADRGRTWARLFGLLLGVAGLLAAYALVQQIVLNEAPRATFLNRNNLAAFLNLALLPLLALLLGRAAREGWSAPRLRRGTALALLIGLAVMLVGSRGALLGLALGSALLVAVFWRELGVRGAVYLAALLLAAFLGAELLGSSLGGKSVAMADPQTAGHSRWVIWQATWAMLQDAPWHGIGPGLFWLAYPPYRLPGDNSGGFYVHNDYLQLWLEGGWPTFVVLALLLATVAWRHARFLRAAPAAGDRHEASGLFAGLLAVAFHSLLTFNFYQLPILIVTGAALARWDRLTAGRLRGVQPAGRFTATGYRLIVLAMLLLPGIYFGGQLAGDALRMRAERVGLEGNFLRVHRDLELAERMAPGIDTLWFLHADFLRRAIAGLPTDAREQRASLYDVAMDKLATAERKNPLRAQVPFVRGMLLLENPELSGAAGREQAHAAFAAALALDPRFLAARLADVDALHQEGRERKARDRLLAGADEAYPHNPLLLNYLQEVAPVLEVTGQHTRLDALRARYSFAFPPSAATQERRADHRQR